MVSIVPVDLLEEAMSNGFDVDSLPTISGTDIGPVFDASGNQMEILGAVTIDVEQEGGSKAKVPIHMSRQNDEVLVGMYGSGQFGVRISVSGAQGEETTDTEDTELAMIENKGTARVIRRTYVPPHSSGMVEVECREVDQGEKIFWSDNE
ncbi:unnamed protein product [Heligmosomoides polygyrus]|uniref:UPF0051 protein ycf24 n=1 Tax=Heligmosomoides polygyrus TaxID=6339 RepID=A0A183F326_HELPZ|nr:unnamed protein product [Heligmosomoides polygyrus]